MTRLGVIVVSYNVRELLARCLTSIASELESNPDVTGEIWVVDNASADGSADLVRQQFPQAHLIASDENLGFARANNVALREMGLPDGDGTPDAVLLLNPDAELKPGSLRSLLQCLFEHPRAAVIGPQLEYGDGRFQHSAFRFPTLAQVFLDFFPLNWRLTESVVNGRYPRSLYEAGAPFAVDFVLGAAMLVRSAAVRDVGLLDEAYFMYAEEMDWCHRFKDAGWQILCCPAARVVHHEGQSARPFRDQMFVALWRSRYRYFERYYPGWWQAIARRLVRLGLWAEARRAHRARAQGKIADEDLDRRLNAYREVARL